MATFLLDVNVLLGLFDPNHPDAKPAGEWFEKVGYRSWAMCPFTQACFVRIMTSPSYAGGSLSPREALDALNKMASHPGYHFFPHDVDFARDGFPVTHKQVTDGFLLAICRKHNLKLATFDHKLSRSLAAKEPNLLELI